MLSRNCWNSSHEVLSSKRQHCILNNFCQDRFFQPEWSDDNRSAAGGHTFQLRPGIMVSLFGINLFLNLSKWIGSSTTGIWLIASILPALLSTWWMDGVSSNKLFKVLSIALISSIMFLFKLSKIYLKSCCACLVSQVVSLSDGCEDQWSEEGRSHLEVYFLAQGYQCATW